MDKDKFSNDIESKEKYLEEIGFNINNYLFSSYKINKDILNEEYNNYFKDNKINKEELEKIIYDIYENKNIKDLYNEDLNRINEEDYEILIDISSPLFNIISKTKNFEKIFTIYINQKDIDKNNLKDDYIKFFDNLNKLNI